jgi:predicted nucleic acid-binding protein
MPWRLSKAEVLVRGGVDRAMLLLDASFLIEFEDELVHRKMGPARGILAAHRRQTVAISIITLGEFAEGFTDPRALVEFLAPFRVVTLSRAIAWRTAALQSSLPRRLGENDAWIAASALSYDATLIGRERAFERVPRLNYLSF